MKYRLAIADDEKLVRESLADFIDWEKLGFELVLLAEDGDAVIEELRHGHLDVLLCDIQMQEKNGLEVAEFIFREKIDCSVVLISGHEEFEYARKAVTYGVMEYLLKPINLEVITKTFLRVKQELDAKKEIKRKQELSLKKESLYRRAVVEQMIEKVLEGDLKTQDAAISLCQKFGVEETILQKKSSMLDIKIGSLKEYGSFDMQIINNILYLISKPVCEAEILMFYGNHEREFRALFLGEYKHEHLSAEEYLNEVRQAVYDICETTVQVRFEKYDICLGELIQYLGEKKEAEASVSDDGKRDVGILMDYESAGVLSERVKQLLMEHLEQNITLSEAAKLVCLSPNYFSRLFKEETGENYTEYSIRIKMEKAAEILRNSEKKVYEIAAELGYQNIKYFYKLFKRNWKCTPSEYREQAFEAKRGGN